MRQRRLEHPDHRIEPFRRLFAGLCGIDAGARTERRYDDHLVADRVEHHHDGRPDQDRVRHADGIGLGRGEPLHVTHHVVAQIAENAGRHRRQVGRHLDGGVGQEGPQRRQRRFRAGLEPVGIVRSRVVDLGAMAGAAPDGIGVEADHRIAAARGVALDGFEQEDVARPALRELEERRHGRLEVGHMHRPGDACAAAAVALVEIAGSDPHGQKAAPAALRTASWLTVIPTLEPNRSR